MCCLLLENLKRFPDVLFRIKCFVLKHLILPFLWPPHYRPVQRRILERESSGMHFFNPLTKVLQLRGKKSISLTKESFISVEITLAFNCLEHIFLMHVGDM